MISQNEISSDSPDPCQHLKRLRPITHHISEAYQSVSPLLRNIYEHRLPRLPVGMDVRENGVTHEIPLGQVTLVDGLSNADALANLALYHGILMRRLPSGLRDS